jgi:hypothetical protein
MSYFLIIRYNEKIRHSRKIVGVSKHNSADVGYTRVHLEYFVENLSVDLYFYKRGHNGGSDWLSHQHDKKR